MCQRYLCRNARNKLLTKETHAVPVRDNSDQNKESDSLTHPMSRLTRIPRRRKIARLILEYFHKYDSVCEGERRDKINKSSSCDETGRSSKENKLRTNKMHLTVPEESSDLEDSRSPPILRTGSLENDFQDACIFDPCIESNMKSDKDINELTIGVFEEEDKFSQTLKEIRNTSITFDSPIVHEGPSGPTTAILAGTYEAIDLLKIRSVFIGHEKIQPGYGISISEIKVFQISSKEDRQLMFQSQPIQGNNAWIDGADSSVRLIAKEGYMGKINCIEKEFVREV